MTAVSDDAPTSETLDEVVARLNTSGWLTCSRN